MNGTLPTGVYAKDIILHLIKTYGVDFGKQAMLWNLLAKQLKTFQWMVE
ncbi:hypothetical protein ACVQ90_11345 [Staphylococcus aureus]